MTPRVSRLLLCAVLPGLFAQVCLAAATQPPIPDSTYLSQADLVAAPVSSFTPTSTAPQKTSRDSFIRRTIAVPDGPAALRLAVWGALSLGEGGYTYKKTTEIWGKPKGKFHFKDDLSGDGLALTDEASHLFLAYKLTQLARHGFRWCGLQPRAAIRAAAIQAAVCMLAVEYPMDAYNPGQGFGISDFVADMAGVGLAWYHAGLGEPRWDLKISVKPQFFKGNRRLIAHTNKQYDDYIYWLTYRMSKNRYDPFVAGIGYSTHHINGRAPDKELHLCIGTSLSEIGRIIGRRTERTLSPAEFYFISIGPRMNWR